MTEAARWQHFRDEVGSELAAALPEEVARLGVESAELLKHQTARLVRLLDYAVRRSAFHRERLAGRDLRGITAAGLTAIPVMTKDEMMASLDDVFTDPRLTRDRVEAALATADETPAIIDGEFLALATGGGSGRRAVITYDRAGLVGYSGSLTRTMAARLQEMAGEGPLPSLTIAMVTAASARHATRAMSHFAAASLPLTFAHVPATLPLGEIVARLNALQPPVLMGYASMLHRLAAEQCAGRLQITPLSISATSETLSNAVRDAITAAFGVAVTNTFGSTEALCGSSAPGDDAIVFNTDHCIAELVDDNYQAVAPGSPSTRVLITNLDNLAQPLIRYELTDRFEQVPNPLGNGHLAAIVHGRSDDLLHFDGKVVHPHAVTGVMVAVPAVDDYQVRQTATGISVDVVVAPGLDAAALVEALRRSLAHAGLATPTVEIHVVEELSRDQSTGKIRRFVPLPAS